MYVLASGVEAITCVEFGIAHTPAARVVGWTSCEGPTTLPTGDWPGNGSGIAIAWSAPQPAVGPDAIVVVGYFTVEAPSAGGITITPDPRSVDEAGSPYVVGDNNSNSPDFPTTPGVFGPTWHHDPTPACTSTDPLEAADCFDGYVIS